MACSCKKNKHKFKLSCIERCDKRFFALFKKGSKIRLIKISKKRFKELKKNDVKICADTKDPPSLNQRGKSILTFREREVFELLVQDLNTAQIAKMLFISEKTVRNHISNVLKKLNVKGRSQAVVELVRMGEIQI